MTVGKIFLVSNNEITYRDIPKMKEAMIVNIDSGMFGNKFYYKNSKERRLANERYADFFLNNLEECVDLEIYAGITGIEEALSTGQDVYLVTSTTNPYKNSHGLTIVKFIDSRLQSGEIKYAPSLS